MIGGVFLFGAERNGTAEVFTASIGALLAGEGIGLMTNWCGGADEVVDIVRGRPPVVRSVVAMQLGKPWFIRGFMGLLALVMAGIFLWAAVRGAIT